MCRLILAAIALPLFVSPASAKPLVIEGPALEVGQARPSALVVRHLPGQGEVKAACNVGRVEVKAVDGAGRVELSYQPPRRGSPQRLLLLLWRATGPARLATLPLSAWTKIEVKTRRGRHLQVQVKVGERLFGPVGSDKKRKVTIRVLVPHGVRQVHAEAWRRAGLVTQREVKLPAVSETLVVVGLRESGQRARGDKRYEIFAAGQDEASRPQMALVPPGGLEAPRPLDMRREGDVFTSAWRPPKAAASGRWIVQVSAGTHRAEQAFTLPALPASKPATSTRSAPPSSRPPSFWGRLRYRAGLFVGAQYDLSELASPRITLEIAAEHPLRSGWIGAQLSTSFAFGSLKIQDGPRAAESDVWMLPFTLAASYTTPSLGRLSGHALVGLVAQLVRSRSKGEISGETAETDVAFGVLAALGGAYRLGPGDLVLRLGYQHARVDTRALKLLAGGLVAEAGYGYLF